MTSALRPLFCLVLMLIIRFDLAQAQNFPNGFPFVLPTNDTASATFLPNFPAVPITNQHKVTASSTGNFLANGAPIRFWGVNLSAAACFPDTAQARAIAGRMRKMGINLVRFHHLDNPHWGGPNTSIFNFTGTTRVLNPVTLLRLDFFIAQLKANGIYVNLNLNVSRTFVAADGVVAADSLQDFGKAVTLYEPYLRFLQKEYAQQLLQHVNPFTGMTYANDPVVAMVEMNNENSLYAYWRGNGLQPYAKGGILPVHYNAVLDSAWHSFLGLKYKSSRDLADAWNADLVPPGFGELLLDGGFESGQPNLHWEQWATNGGSISSRTESSIKAEGTKAVSIRAATLGTEDWHIQYFQTGFTLKKDTTYTLRFKARSNAPADLRAFVQRNEAPWTTYTFLNVATTTTWQTYELLFTPTEDVTDLGKIAFSPVTQSVRYYIDGVTIRALYQAPQTGVLANQITNGTFETGAVAPWQVESHNGALATFTASTSNPQSGTYSGRFNVTNVTGTDWHLQLKQVGASIQQDSFYQLRFFARAGAGSPTLAFYLMRDNDPYTYYAGNSVTLTTTWKEYNFTFWAPETNLGQVRIAFNPGQQTGTFFLDNITFGKPQPTGLQTAESIQFGTIERINFHEKLSFSDKRVADLTEFYTNLEKWHLEELRTFLKTNLGVTAPITGSNALTGLQDVYRHEKMDYIDDHAYWDHPQFPGQPWSETNWLINNNAMVKSQSFDALSSMISGLSMKGKPYTISEYNHGAPNRYRVEMVPAMAAYSAFHGVDGIMFFDYNSSTNWTADHVSGYFPLHRDNSIMALFPSCAMAYRQGLIKEDRQPITLDYSPNWVYNSTKGDISGRWGAYLPYGQRIGLVKNVKTGIFDQTKTPNFAALPAEPAGPIFQTSTNQIKLDNNKGILTVNTPRFISITGFFQDAANTTVGDLRLVNGSDFGAITWLSLDNAALRNSQKSLLTVSSRQQNSGMVWNANNTSVGNQWGTAPTVQNPISVTLRLRTAAPAVCVSTLNAQGSPVGTCQNYTTSSSGFVTITLNQDEENTLWFGIEADEPDNSLSPGEIPEEVEYVFNDVLASPNPTNEMLRITFENPGEMPVAVWIYDAYGHPVRRVGRAQPTMDIDVQDLLPGIYTIHTSWANRRPTQTRFVKIEK